MGMLGQAEQGAVDTTSAEAEADPNVFGTAASVQGGVNVARQASDTTPSANADEEEATPEEQKSYEEAMGVAQQVLYENDDTSAAIAQMIQPNSKIESTVRATLLALSKIDKKVDLDEGAVAQFSMDLTDMIVDLAEEGKGMAFSEGEAQAVWGSVWEGVMEMYGVDEEEYSSFTDSMSDEEIEGQNQQYKQFLGE